MTTIDSTKKIHSIGTKSVKKSVMAFLAYYGIMCFFKGHKWKNKIGCNNEPYADCTVCPCWKADGKITIMRTDWDEVISLFITMSIASCIGGLILCLLSLFNII